MADGTQVRRVLLQIKTDDGDTEEKLDKINAKADELKAKHPELSVKIDTAAASAKLGILRQELKDVAKPVEAKIKPELDEAKAAEVVAESKALGDAAGSQSGSGFGGAFSNGLMSPAVIGPAVGAALAGLPAIAGGFGALAGIALGAKLLIGSSQVKGPLYAQFTDLMKTLVSVMRVAALPLLKPLADAFAQIGQWAKDMYPEIRAVFASLGPLVAPFAKGLEGLVSGVLPGFLHLMQAARPAVQAVAGLLSQLGTQLGSTFNALIPGVKTSAEFLTALGRAVFSLLPLVARLANVAAGALGPIMATLGGKLLPQLVNALDNTLAALTPILPPLGQLVATILQFNVGPMVAGLSTIGNILVRLEPVIQTVANMLQGLADMASGVLSLLSRIPGAGGIFSGAGALAPGAGIGGIAGLVGSAGDPFAGSSAFDSAAASAAGMYGSNWANGVTGSMLGNTQRAGQQARQAAANIPLILAQGIMAGLTGTASQVAAAIGKLLGAIATDVSGKYLTTAEGTAISKWLEADGHRLEQLANKRARILATIAKADAYSANIVSSTESTFGVVSAAQSITPALGVGGILRQLFGDVAQIRTFRNNIAKLRKMGLNRAYIDQLIQAGPVTGGQVAAELAAGNEGDIRQVNRAESQIAQASISLGQTAADAMFDTGKGAGKGFLSGLESQQKAIEAEMKKIAGGLVREMARIEIHLTGGDREFRQWLKKSIRITGGNVTIVGA